MPLSGPPNATHFDTIKYSTRVYFSREILLQKNKIEAKSINLSGACLVVGQYKAAG